MPKAKPKGAKKSKQIQQLSSAYQGGKQADVKRPNQWKKKK